MPEGFRYQDDIISEVDEAALAMSLATLDLKPFEFRGHLGNRRVTSFGLHYDYARHAVEAADAFPSFLADLRNKVAKFAGRKAGEFQQAGVNEYPAGAGIGGTLQKDITCFGSVNESTNGNRSN
jgi:alkylated DNA repair dioxygenase AlkB